MPWPRPVAIWCRKPISTACSSMRSQGYTHFVFHEYDTNWDGKAYQTVSGQNSNNSVRIPNGFFDVLETGRRLGIRRRIDGKVIQDGQGARPLGQDRLGGLDLRRSRHAVRHDHQ